MLLSTTSLQLLTLIAVLVGPFTEPSPPPEHAPATGQRPAPVSPFDLPPVEEPKDPIDRLFERAARLRAEGKALGRTDAGRSYLRASAVLAEETARLDPNRCEAYQLWGQALMLHAQFTDEPEPRAKLLAKGNDTFQRAEKCGEVDASFYGQWAEGTVRIAMGPATADDQRLGFIRQAADAIDRGLARFDGSEDRQQLLPVAAMVAMAMGEKTDEPADRIRWYKQSIERYRAADRIKTRLSGFQETLWIEALYRLGDLGGDPEPAREAVTRAKNMLRVHPDHPLVHYRLACALSLLGEYETAVQHLQFSVEKNKEYYLSAARSDPALRGLRASNLWPAFLEEHTDGKK